MLKENNGADSINSPDNAYDYLLNLLSETTDKSVLSAIFEALLTEKEQLELANRLTIFALLQQGVTQREISAQLGVGIATVSRGAKVFNQHHVDELLPNISQRIKR